MFSQNFQFLARSSLASWKVSKFGTWAQICRMLYNTFRYFYINILSGNISRLKLKKFNCLGSLTKWHTIFFRKWLFKLNLIKMNSFFTCLMYTIEYFLSEAPNELHCRDSPTGVAECPCQTPPDKQVADIAAVNYVWSWPWTHASDSLITCSENSGQSKQ